MGRTSTLRTRLRPRPADAGREPVLPPGPLPRVLFLTSGSDDYVSDSLMHGLRELLGERVVDQPRADQLYRDQGPERRARRYGRAFTLYGGLLDDLDVDRTWISERVASGEFDLVVIGDLWRRAGALSDLLPLLPDTTTLAVVDGADTPKMYPYAPAFWLRPGGLTLPRAHRRGVYFKREVTSATAFWRCFGLLPGALAERLGATRGVRPIAISIPASAVVGDDLLDAPRPRRFQSHIVDPEVAEAVGASVAKPFETQDEYYADLRSSRFGITVKREGWDALRHYEIAAAGAIPCFRHLDAKPPRCAPHGLVDGVNCLAYDDVAALRARIDALGPERERALRAGTLAWAREHTTRAEAARFLAACGRPLPAA
ncbi:MAG TPA: hypothetical protein VFG42_21955 [Baekduia sp.]|uniref:hypothetical protein n=1 Tax=Baekduia sp. TaxID=2600305 RepID=UPI002D78F842|nr:hypothetical protein [Baekduia sp.]HET6509478.1 hypothetical protein [Baekduia sp.]